MQISYLQIRLLEFFASRPFPANWVDMNELRARFPRDRVTLWQSLESLEKKGLIERTFVVGKGRRMHYMATQKGFKASQILISLEQMGVR